MSPHDGSARTRSTDRAERSDRATKTQIERKYRSRDKTTDRVTKAQIERNAHWADRACIQYLGSLLLCLAVVRDSRAGGYGSERGEEEP